MHLTKFALSSLICALILSNASHAQDSTGDHEKHHPQAPEKSKPSTSELQRGKEEMGGMMDDMMKGMEGPKKKEFYPSMMTVPQLSESERTEWEARAEERIRSGHDVLAKSVPELMKAAEGKDYTRVKERTADVRDGLAQLESGMAAHEGLTQGKSVQEIGLLWFKQNLNLEGSHWKRDTVRTYYGLTFFHFFVMILLTFTSLTLLAMYFFKMRRATQILARLETESGSPATVSATPGTVTGAAASPIHEIHQPWRGKLKVSNIYQETPTVKTFRLVMPDGKDLPFTYLAGQFMTLSVVIDGKPIKRSYTIASHPCDKKMLEITIKREENGLVSRYMHDVIHEDDLIEIEAAHGNLTFSGVTGEGIVLIGGGVGITPLMSVLRCLISCGMKNEIKLLYACKSLKEFIFKDELRQIQERNPNLEILVAVDKLEGSFPGAYEGRLTKEKIQEAAPNIANSRVHLCGPPGMMHAVRAILAELKVPEEQIKTEAFGPAQAPPAKPLSPAGNVQPNAGALKQVTFQKAGKVVGIHEGETVLELAESSGVEIPFSCRVGTCGTCKVRLLSGEVTMEVQDSLTEEDKRARLVLACQAKARSNLVIEEL